MSGTSTNLTQEKIQVTKQILERKYSTLLDEAKEKFSLASKGVTPPSGYQAMISKRRKKSQYEKITVIGRGAFGEVLLCHDKKLDKLVAMKLLKKSEMLRRNQVSHVRAERDILAEAGSDWIVNLECSFQDDDYLYLIMEYMPGGDMMTWLINKEVFTEDETRFYIAELVLAIANIHKLDYVHRDLKPDNILLDLNGHIKMSDFGLSKPMKHGNPNDANYGSTLKKKAMSTSKDNSLSHKEKQRTWKNKGRILAQSVVGSNGYIAPEVLLKKGYGLECDWWSCGIIMFEMLCGYPPFISDNPVQTCHKIVRWREFLEFPEDVILSHEARDLITKLLCDPDERLGRNGVQEIKNHPFFKGVDWKNIRAVKAPFTPHLTSDRDTRYFDSLDEDTLFNSAKLKMIGHRNVLQDKNHVFYGYSYDGRQIKKLEQKKIKLQSLFDPPTAKKEEGTAKGTLIG